MKIESKGIEVEDRTPQGVRHGEGRNKQKYSEFLKELSCSSYETGTEKLLRK
jgi:hypothetical protein